MRILLADDESSQRSLLAGFLAKQGFTVHQAESGEQALASYREHFSPVVISDMKMGGMSGLDLLVHLREINPFVQVIILTAYGTIDTAVTAMRSGAYDFLTKPVQDLDELLAKITKASQQNRILVEHQIMSRKLDELFPDSEIIGNSESIRKAKENIARFGKTDATVLITGPTGTGKELVARALHAVSDRADKRLVAINCSAFPEGLLESELFGHEKGAFTGADKQKVGHIELADGGTLFLDEIGELPLTLQAKLLRVLEHKEVTRVGGTKPIFVDFRLVSATNRNLESQVASGLFRQDLLYRLNTVLIDLPPLREREGDILLLAQEFLKRASIRFRKQVTKIDQKAADILLRYDWPGNVRELQHTIERAVILSDHDRITPQELTDLLPKAVSAPLSAPSDLTLSELESRHIKATLDKLDWNMGKAADSLGIHRNTLRLKISEYKLERD